MSEARIVAQRIQQAVVARLHEPESKMARAYRGHDYCGSKSLFGAPQSGQIHESGKSAQRVPGGIPCAGSPAVSS
jgi:hypothetical protein